jgi:hypothetical protein
MALCWNRSAVASLLALSTGLCGATTLSGNLGDPTNSALVGSDLGGPLFDTPDDIADNVAIYQVVVPADGELDIVSTGYAAGGIDPYYTLFAGAGPAATFYASNYAQAYSTGGDFEFDQVVPAGTYQIALGTFANMSFAENLGVGTLADGFIELGLTYALGDGSYALTVNVDGGTAPVPEPANAMLILAGLAAWGASARRWSLRR